MSAIEIAVINASTAVKGPEVAKTAAALQIQLQRDFKTRWGIDASVEMVSKPQQASKLWQLVILDNSDQAGALGYHDLTSAGMPLGKVFAGSDKQYGLNWTVTASHELLEMVADPNINLVAFSAENSMLYAYEVCDACEADRFGYEIDGVLVSDFVFPGWFEPLRVSKNEAFDFQKKIKKPFALLPGGYIGVFHIEKGSGWSQLTAAGEPPNYLARPPIGSRRERRKLPKSEWLRSNS